MKPSEEGVGGGGWLTMKNHSVEIAIAAGEEEIVRAHLLGGLFLFFVYIMYYLLGTRTRVQRWLWRKENLNPK